MSGDYLYVKNWQDLQHYTKRNPPWIKLYRRLLKEGDFLHLSELEQWQLVRIWLVSAEEHPGGWIPNNHSWVRRAIGTERAVPLQKFVNQGWLQVMSASAHASAVASTVLADEAPDEPSVETRKSSRKRLASPIELPSASNGRETADSSQTAPDFASTAASTDARKDPPKLPPRDTEIHKEPSSSTSTTTPARDPGVEEGRVFNLERVLKDVDAA